MPSLTTTGLQSGPVGAASVEPLPAAMDHYRHAVSGALRTFDSADDFVGTWHAVDSTPVAAGALREALTRGLRAT